MTINADTEPADMRSVFEAGYKIVARGELDPRYAVLFEGMKIERVEGRTVLTGRVLDQSQLHGFARCLMDLGLELLSLERNPALEVSALHVESRFPARNLHRCPR